MNSKNNISLWQLTNEHQKLLSELYDYETGEVNEIVQARLNELDNTIEKKCISVTKYINLLESQRNELEKLLENVIERGQSYSKEINKYRKYLEVNMDKQNINKITCPYFTIKLKKNPYSTDITDRDSIPEHFIRTRQVVKEEIRVDREAIKEEFLRTGVQVPGAHVSKKNKLEIVTDKL